MLVVEGAKKKNLNDVTAHVQHQDVEVAFRRFVQMVPPRCTLKAYFAQHALGPEALRHMRHRFACSVAASSVASYFGYSFGIGALLQVPEIAAFRLTGGLPSILHKDCLDQLLLHKLHCPACGVEPTEGSKVQGSTPKGKSTLSTKEVERRRPRGCFRNSQRCGGRQFRDAQAWRFRGLGRTRRRPRFALRKMQDLEAGPPWRLPAAVRSRGRCSCAHRVCGPQLGVDVPTRRRRRAESHEGHGVGVRLPPKPKSIRGWTPTDGSRAAYREECHRIVSGRQPTLAELGNALDLDLCVETSIFAAATSK